MSHLPSPRSIAADGLWQFRQLWAWRVFARGYRAARRGGRGPPNSGLWGGAGCALPGEAVTENALSRPVN